MEAPEIPKPEEFVGALASFPPKLSVLAKPFTIPEDFFEGLAKSATGMELPPGPTKMLKTLMESFEAGAPAGLPSLPGLPSPSAPASEKTAGKTAEKTYGKATRGKVDVELF